MRMLVFAAAMILAACDDKPTVPLFGKDDKQDLEISGLKAQIENLNKWVIEARGEASKGTWANLDVTDKDFAFVNAGGSVLAFAVRSVTPNGSGSTLKLTIGNPSAAKITSLYLDMSYGKSTKDGLLTSPSFDKDETVITPLPPGEWTDVTIGLPNLATKDLGIVRINGAVVERMTLQRTSRSETAAPAASPAA